ncbi:2171_t:CDS:2, partial [Funneliformis geosporum]
MLQKCDETYDNGNGISKEEYWSRIVNISIEVIERLRDEVNDFLRNDNGSTYLKMAYEEVLFSVVFTGKKKYYSISHRRESNFNNKLFIRGVEIVKRRQSKYFREVDRYSCEEADTKQRIKKGLTPEPYLYEIPEPDERFEYIIAENDLSCLSAFS